MKNNLLKPFFLCFMFSVLCFQLAACGNQSDNYNADETTNTSMESNTNNMTEDGINDAGSQSDAGPGADSGSQSHSGAGNDLGQDIENAGDAIMDGAEDLFDGEDSTNSVNTSSENNGTQNNNKNNH